MLRSAVELADAQGLAALTIRSLARALGVKPMSIYHHVANKEAILDGIVDAVFGEIHVPSTHVPWREAITARLGSAREVLLSHPWAVPLMESRSSPGPATLRQHEATLAVLRGAGFPLPAAAHAYALLDAYLYGSVLQASALPFDDADSAAEVAGSMMTAFSAGQYPHLVEIATQHVLQPGYSFGDEFGFGLELILDGLERLL
ncbi:MAG: TetR/AcrR family transcriptional regulator [Micrococcus sp.]|nr:TetR/AcrR family transcriptional regulator [Micrococcus sp.]